MESQKFKESVALIIDPRGFLSPDNLNAIERHKIYAKELIKLSNKTRMKLVAISSSNDFNYPKNYSNNFFIKYASKPTFNIIKFAFKTAQILKKNSWSPNLFIVSDPWESYWCAYFLRILLRTDVKIQIQIHGDFANPLWRKLNKRNRIRYFFLKFSMRNCNFYRFVSKPQANFFINAFNIDPRSVDIIPVPFFISEIPKSSIKKYSKSIGLVGRIQADRGIWEFFNLINKLKGNSKLFDIIVIGDGPEKQEFLTKLSSLDPKLNIYYLGHLSRVRLLKTWGGIGVLISLAPTESYGLAIREAIVAGVPVWAKISSGVEDLLSKSKRTPVKILDLTKSGKELSKELDQLFKMKVNLKLRKQIIKENSTYSRSLAKSWLKLMD